MEQEAAASRVVYVSGMHPELVPGHLPAEVLWFNPGIAGKQTTSGTGSQRACYTPVNLPLTPQQARAWLRDILAYGLQFQRPGELAATVAASHSTAHVPPGSLRKDEDADLGRFSASGFVPGAEQGGDPAQKLLTQAQMTLLLAWDLEERHMELAGLDKDLSASTRRFESALHADDERGESEFSAPALNASAAGSEGDEPTPAQRMRVLEAMLAWLPRGTWICTDDKILAAAWCEAGISAESGSDALPEALQGVSAKILRAPGWRLCGHSQPVKDKPWLDIVTPVAIIDNL